MGPIHDRAVIISTGDEVITGQILDSNSQWLAQRLMDLGILPIEHITVPDDLDALVAALRRAASAAPLVVMTGGLGPTDGDLTRAALAKLLGQDLVTDADAQEALRRMLSRRGREVSPRQARQAQRPSGARCLPNDFGTAPGLWAHHAAADADLLCLPGPPGELRPMWQRQAPQLLRPDPHITVATRLLHICGVPEADAVTRLGNLTRRDAMPLVGITASGGILTLRMRYQGPAPRPEAETLLDSAEAAARAALGDNIFASGPGPGDESLARTVIAALAARGQTLAVAESCTGGMLGQLITAIPGSSAAFLGGAVTYANTLKQAIGVPERVLAAHGAVSPQAAESMAHSARAWAGADWALSLTGIAGPDGGSDAKPVGTVWIGLASGSGGAGGAGGAGQSVGVHSRRFIFTGDRDDVRRRAAVTALAMLHFALRGHHAGSPRLLWESPPEPTQ